MVRFISDNREVNKTKPVNIRVICAGPPRAATSSMQAAIERLGFGPCLHMAHVLPHPDRAKLLLKAAREQDKEKRQEMVGEIMAGHASVADLPVIFFAHDLMDMYPDAAIVLNQRASAAVWSASAQESFEFFFSWRFFLVGLLFRADRMWYALNIEGTRWCARNYGNPVVWSTDVYEGHRKWVLAEAKRRGRPVLEFMPEQGWGPLCEFLGVEVPDEPFPKLNERETFQFVKKVIIVKGLLSWAALGAGVWASWRFGPLGIRFLRTMLKTYL
ncbi:hypothetical protein F4861DRAFT_288051 [Xylaria intraflava]|nr:hypothetical protein F4861DRAFT_288051 [Xylaria intraflava]